MWLIDSLLILLILSSLLHLVPSRHWFFEVAIYFSQQIFVFLSLLLILKIGLAPSFSLTDTIISLIAAGCASYHFSKFLPYTYFWKNEVPTASSVDARQDISLLVANVYQENRQYQRLADTISSILPDLVVLLETDGKWVESLKDLIEPTAYPYHILKPQSNTYGLALWSKIPILEGQVEYITNVPSIQARLQLQGYDIDLFVLHPEPPAPGEAQTSLPKDREILGVATRVKDLDGPVIVTGDMNEVPWSSTSKRFLRTSGLLDPRKGRHILSTFPVYLPLFRFPLDYIFCTSHFSILKYRRMPDIGSDHYPLFIKLAINSHRTN